jgi:hypothetical protein
MCDSELGVADNLLSRSFLIIKDLHDAGTITTEKRTSEKESGLKALRSLDGGAFS